MGKARPVVARSNFSQNVLRAVRQEPEAVDWRGKVEEWLVSWRRPLVGGLAVALLVVTGAVLQNNYRITPIAAVAVVPDADLAAIADEDVSVPLDSLDHMDALLAMEDTSKLTDTELQFLLY